MKQSNKKNRFAILLAIGTLCTFLFSFSGAGGDHFEIYLNEKLLHKQFMHGEKNVYALNLENAKPSDRVRLTYSHCGKLGMDRTVIIRNENKELKKWSYKNGTSTSKYLTFRVEDIMGLQKQGNLQIVYVSRELPKGQVLAMISANSAIAKKIVCVFLQRSM